MCNYEQSLVGAQWHAISTQKLKAKSYARFLTRPRTTNLYDNANKDSKPTRMWRKGMKSNDAFCDRSLRSCEKCHDTIQERIMTFWHVSLTSSLRDVQRAHGPYITITMAFTSFFQCIQFTQTNFIASYRYYWYFVQSFLNRFCGKWLEQRVWISFLAHFVIMRCKCRRRQRWKVVLHNNKKTI